jgi:hypothetical protein
MIRVIIILATRLLRILAFVLLLALAVKFTALLGTAHGQTPNEWWTLTLELQRSRINNEPDRQFIRKMINELAVSPDAVPTIAQQHWLLSIKKELDRRSR